MSYGATPRYTVAINLNDRAPSQFLALCLESAEALNWKIKSAGEQGFIALSDKTFLKVKQRITLQLTEGHAQLLSESRVGALLDRGRNRINVVRFIAMLNEGGADLQPDQIVETGPGESGVVQNSGVVALFVPRKGYYVTPILVDLNLAIFLLMVISGVSVFSPTLANRLNWGANLQSLTLDGQWWRLITNTFIHIGILHVLFNMYALLYIGMLLEPELGRIRFITAYLLTGIVASVTSMSWHPAIISAGASGAIFGVYGVFLALLTTNLIEKSVRANLMPSIAVFVAYNLLNGTQKDIDNAAHIGGLVSGIVVGYLFYPGLKNPFRPGLRYSGLVAAAILTLTGTVIAFKESPKDYVLYERKYRAFFRLEKQALSMLNPQGGISEEAQRKAIGDKGISDWDSSIIILNQARQLKVIDELKEKADRLVRYCRWRIQIYSYVYRKMGDSTGLAAEDSINYYNKKIMSVIDSLSAANQ